MTASATCVEAPGGKGEAAGSCQPIRDGGIAVHLARCARLLREQQPLWQPVAFRELHLAWEDTLPGLARLLRQLPLEQAERLHADPLAADRLLGHWLPVDELRDCERIGAWPRLLLQAWPRGFACDVPGRKWRQIEDFLAAVPPEEESLLDWCAGKGHLARAACWQWSARRVAALERDVALVDASDALARRSRLPVRSVHCDVLGDAAVDMLTSHQHVLALHACGSLHRRLFELGVARQVAALSCAPCCYHLEVAGESVAMSRAGATSLPSLGAADRRTAVQETVTAPGHAQRRRQRLQQWQLGFDLLQREVRGSDTYLPVSGHSVAGGFADFTRFCEAAAMRKGIVLPAGIDFAQYERAGIERFRLVTALDLVRHRFRRLIELWLVLDRAQFLVEAGYRVGVGVFCERQVSPRNLLVHARCP